MEMSNPLEITDGWLFRVTFHYGDGELITKDFYYQYDLDDNEQLGQFGLKVCNHLGIPIAYVDKFYYNKLSRIFDGAL